MANRVQTKQMGNFNMAAAGDRILAFWEKNPQGKIYTDKNEKDLDDKGKEVKVFVSYIWKDNKTWLEALKSMPAGVSKETAEYILLMSADTNAPAKQPSGAEGKKDFEKLDTVSVGRALAKLGFLKDGQVASNEELEDRGYQEYLDTQADEFMFRLSQAENLAELQELWTSAKGKLKAEKKVIEKKDEVKALLMKKETESK